jgi:hypothetical protein
MRYFALSFWCAMLRSTSVRRRAGIARRPFLVPLFVFMVCYLLPSESDEKKDYTYPSRRRCVLRPAHQVSSSSRSDTCIRGRRRSIEFTTGLTEAAGRERNAPSISLQVVAAVHVPIKVFFLVRDFRNLAGNRLSRAPPKNAHTVRNNSVEFEF